MPYLARASNEKTEIHLYAKEPVWCEQSMCGICGGSIGYWSNKPQETTRRVALPHHEVPTIKPGECFRVEIIVKGGEC